MQAHGDGRTELLTLELSYNDVVHSPTGIMEAVPGYVPLRYPWRFTCDPSSLVSILDICCHTFVGSVAD